MDKQEKMDRVLRLIHKEGYTCLQDITTYFNDYITPIAWETINSYILDFRARKIIAIRELNRRKGTTQILHLTHKGLEYLGCDDKSCKTYEAHLKSGIVKFIDHYFLARSFERKLSMDVRKLKDCGYSMKSWNEFSDKEKLQKTIPNHREFLRPDGEVLLKKNGLETLNIFVEADTGTMTLESQIRKKLDRYAMYYKKAVKEEYAHFPVYIVLIIPSKKRIENFFEKFKQHPIFPHLLFLHSGSVRNANIRQKFAKHLDRKATMYSELRIEIERELGISIPLTSTITVKEAGKGWEIEDRENYKKYRVKKLNRDYLYIQETCNVFEKKVLLSSKRSLISLKELLDERYSLLLFHHAIKQAKELNYEIISENIYTSSYQNSHFPTYIKVQGQTIQFTPHGYLKLKKDNRDKLFLLIISMKNIDSREALEELLILYEAFLLNANEMRKIVQLPIFFGVLGIVADHQEQENFSEMIKKFPTLVKNTKMVKVADCTAEVLTSKVWRSVGEDMPTIALIKPVRLKVDGN